MDDPHIDPPAWHVDLYTIPRPDRPNAPVHRGTRPSGRVHLRPGLVCRFQEIMKERLKQFVADKRGVSPVIGVMNTPRYSSDYMKVS